MIKADYHTHTSFSTDSECNPESMAERAVAMGLEILCITDHMDYFFPYPPDGNFTFDPDKYFTSLENLKVKYKNRLDIRIGVELGLRNEKDIIEKTQIKCSELVNKYPLDFVIGSTHILAYEDPFYAEYWNKRTRAEGLREYFISILDNIKNYNCFDIYGHLDYIVRYMPTEPRDYNYNDYREIIDEILKGLITAGKGIEINTAGIRYGLDFCHPKKEIMKRYRELGGEIVTIGSDAHKAEYLAGNFDQACKLLSSVGFDYYTVFKNRKPVMKKL